MMKSEMARMNSTSQFNSEKNAKLLNIFDIESIHGQQLLIASSLLGTVSRSTSPDKSKLSTIFASALPPGICSLFLHLSFKPQFKLSVRPLLITLFKITPSHQKFPSASSVSFFSTTLITIWHNLCVFYLSIVIFIH